MAKAKAGNSAQSGKVGGAKGVKKPSPTDGGSLKVKGTKKGK